jgi:hypothetical protein
MAAHIAPTVSASWNTPQWIVDVVREQFGEIDLDPCSNEHSLVAARHNIILPIDGLKAPWMGKVFCNPPYGRDKVRKTSILDWCRKAHMERLRGHASEVLLLIPAATETKHWQDIIWPGAASICFLRSRVKFLLDGKERAGSTVGNAVVYFGLDRERFKEVWSKHGYVIDLSGQ